MTCAVVGNMLIEVPDDQFDHLGSVDVLEVHHVVLVLLPEGLPHVGPLLTSGLFHPLHGTLGHGQIQSGC